MKTKILPAPAAPPPILADDGANALQIHFYVDAVAGPTVALDVLDAAGQPVYRAVYAMSAITSLTAPQKANLRAALTTIRDEIFTKEGFT
jgi:hypothetical protein